MLKKIALCMILLARISTGSEWKYTKTEDPFRDNGYDHFQIEGNYILKPSNMREIPRLFVFCRNRRFAGAGFVPGARIETEGASGLTGAPVASVDIRIDDRKATNELWNITKDLTTVSINKESFIRLLTGKLLGHPGSPESLASKLLLGVSELNGGKVAVELEMPDNASQMVEACGLEWGKKRK